MDEGKAQQPIRTVVIQDKTLRRLSGGFTQVPNFLLRRKDLTPGAKITYSLLLSYAWQENFCFPAQEQIAKDSGYSVRQVQRTLVELRENGLVTWKQLGLNRPNVYTLLPVFEEEEEKAVENSGHDKMSLPDTTPMSLPDTTPMSYYKYSDVKDSKNNVNVAFSSNREKDFPSSPADELLLSDIIAELHDKNPKSKAAFRKIINVLGSEAVRQLLSLTNEAYRLGQIRGKKAPYFIGMAKNIAEERGLDLGFASGTKKGKPRTDEDQAADRESLNLPPQLKAAFLRLKSKVGHPGAVRLAKAYPNT